MWRFLCVEDDPKIAAQIAEYFTAWEKDNPFGKIEAIVETGFDEAKKKLATERFDLVTLDLHGVKDPEPGLGDQNGAAQEGRRVLEELKKTRFVPVIFYSGYADKIENLKSAVIQVVKKGEDDLVQVRNAAKVIFSTGLPTLIRYIEQEQRAYIWDTVDEHWNKFAGESNPEELSYLLARRLAAGLNQEGIKALLGHKRELARPIEYYIYPPVTLKIMTGYVFCSDKNKEFWIVATPGCDFEQKDKIDRILLIGATELSADPRLDEWKKYKWTPDGKDPDKKAGAAYEKLRKVLGNKAGDRFRFLPGTFFLPDLIADFQRLRQVTKDELKDMQHICSLDSPYKEEFVLQFSNYYGRLGTPDLEIEVVLERLKT